MAASVSPYCVSVYVLHKTDNDCRYLLIRRSGNYLPNTWQMVTGGIDPGETAWQAALREVKEETSLVPDSLYEADAVETFYMLATDKVAFVPVFVAFVDGVKEVQLSPKEHDDFEWLPVDLAALRLVWSEQRRIIREVHERFVLNTPHPLLKIEFNPCESKKQQKVSGK